MERISLDIYKALVSLLPSRLKKIGKLVYYSDEFNNARRIMHPLTIKYKFNRKFLEHKESFLKLHLGCGNRNFPGYINIDFRKTKATDYVCSNIRLPFSDVSVELIETYNLIEHLPKDLLPKAFQNWWDKLIPGGKLVIECPDFDKTVTEYLEVNDKRVNNIFGLRRFREDVHLWGYNFYRLKKILVECGYKGVKRCIPQDYHRLQESRMQVEAYKSMNQEIIQTPDQEWLRRKEKRPETLTLEWRKNHIHAKILNELENTLFNDKKTVSLGCGTGELEVILGKRGYSIVGIDISKSALQIAKKHKNKECLSNVQFVNASIDNLPFSQNSFDSALMIEVLEHIDSGDAGKIFTEIKRVLKPCAKMLITVPNKFAYYDPGHMQIFTKGRLAELLDGQDLSIKWIELERRRDAYREYDMLKAMCTNKSKIYNQNRKICAIGAYTTRYDELGYHWDGQERAFHSLGYNPLFLDIRKDTYKNLRRKIIEFNPDILWLGLKDCLPFIEWMKEDLKKIGCMIIYWYCDLRGIEGIKGVFPLGRPVIDAKKIGSLLDYIFLSNAGQIEDYKRTYGTEKVFYMGQSCSPTFHHRVNLKEKYDIAFAGKTDKSIFHKERTKLIRKISRHYNTIIRNDVRNNIAEFYSSSKIVFGAEILSEERKFLPYLYTSNRFFVALGCGAFYLCQWFPGIEKLAQNHKQLVWFKTEKELFELVDYYLKHDEQREMIRKSAQELAHSKHTYVHRIHNMLDIIDGKTNDFYGFLQGDGS